MAERPSARAPGGAAGRSLMPSLTTKEPANRVVKVRLGLIYCDQQHGRANVLFPRKNDKASKHEASLT